MYWFYSFVIRLLQPLLTLKLYYRSQKEPLYRYRKRARFGYYGKDKKPPANTLVWVHAVSLGETKVASLLLQSLRNQLPKVRFLLTHSTATGWEYGKTLLKPGDLQIWLPWDTPQATKRFYRHFRPCIGIIIETEVWANLLRTAHLEGIPILLANGRLREQSYRRYQWFLSFFSNTFHYFTWVGAQTKTDAERFTKLGAKNIEVTGNMKFDATPDPQQLSLGREWRHKFKKPILTFASTREGEEVLFLNAIQQHMEVIHKLTVQCILVPRHPQRFESIAELIQKKGFMLLRRSQPEDLLKISSPILDKPLKVYLGDSLGEMTFYYALSSVVLMGGSFLPYGGQNLIEACACHCPVWVGSHTYNFSQATQLGQAAGVVFCSNTMDIALEEALTLIENTEKLAQMRAKALQFAQNHSGATTIVTKKICDLYGTTIAK
jgi:3-deoxy-D-manno-octulosonic-acid transferase